MCTYVYVYGYVHMSVGTQGGQKVASDPLELELTGSYECLMQKLVTKLRSSERVVYAHNHLSRQQHNFKYVEINENKFNKSCDRLKKQCLGESIIELSAV